MPLFLLGITDKVVIIGDGNPKADGTMMMNFGCFVFCRVTFSSFPSNFVLSLGHPMFVKGEASNFDIEAHFGVEASELYPEVKYTTVDEYMHQFV
ncbi:hypothetical protein V6N13_127792 [Hibiscus sabdariffa]